MLQDPHNQMVPTDSEKLVVFVETEAQLETILSYQRQNKVDVQVITVMPEAEYAADVRGLECCSIEQFYRDDALNRVGLRNFTRAFDLCTLIDNHLQRAMANSPVRDLATSFPNFYYIHQLLNSLLYRSLTLLAACAATQPDTLISFQAPVHNPRIWNYLAEGRLVSRMVPLIARQLGMRSIVLLSPEQERIPTIFTRLQQVKSYSRPILYVIPGARNLYKILQSMRKQPPHLLDLQTTLPVLVHIAGDSYASGVIATTWKEHYQGNCITAEDIVEHIEHRDRVDLNRLDGHIHCACTQAWRTLCQDESFRSLFINASLDLFALAEPPLRDFFHSYLPYHIRSGEAFRRGVQQIPTSVVLVPAAGTYLDAARTVNRPVVSFQHGGGYGYLDYPLVEHHDLYGVDYFLVYGQGVVDTLAHPSPLVPPRTDIPRAQIVPIGSPILDKLVAEKRTSETERIIIRNKHTIAYIVSVLHGDINIFNYGMYPDWWYWRFQREVIRICTKHTNVEIIVKLFPRTWTGLPRHPAHNPLEDWLETTRLPRCRVVYDTPRLHDLLSEADMFIIDLPSSTTPLEVLATNKPVLMLADSRWVRLLPHAEALLRKRAIVATNGDQFLQELEAFVQRDEWHLPQPVNDDFLKAYGTHLNDGASAERATHFLYQLAMHGIQNKG